MQIRLTCDADIFDFFHLFTSTLRPLSSTVGPTVGFALGWEQIAPKLATFRPSLFTRLGQIDQVRHLQTRFFSKLTICFFVTFNRKPYAKSRLVTSPMTSDDRKWSKRAKPEVVLLVLTFRDHWRSTTMAPFERAWASFALKVLSDCPYLAPFPRYRRRKSDYVMPKKSSYENVQLPKKITFYGEFQPLPRVRL